MRLKKAVSIGANIVGFFTYSVAVTITKTDVDECQVYVDVHGKHSDELQPFFDHLKRHKFYWCIEDNGLLKIYDGQTNESQGMQKQ